MWIAESSIIHFWTAMLIENQSEKCFHSESDRERLFSWLSDQIFIFLGSFQLLFSATLVSGYDEALGEIFSSTGHWQQLMMEINLDKPQASLCRTLKQVPVAVMTQDWETLSFSGGRVISENPAATKPCKRKERANKSELAWRPWSLIHDMIASQHFKLQNMCCLFV